MKIAYLFPLLLTIIAGFGTCVYAQTGAAETHSPLAVKPVSAAVQPTPSTAINEEESTAQISSFKLDFKPQPAIPGVVASPIFVSPVQCSPEGIPFIDYPQMPDFLEH